MITRVLDFVSYHYMEDIGFRGYGEDLSHQ